MWAALLITGLLLPPRAATHAGLVNSPARLAADSAPTPPSHITEDEKMAIVRSLISEVGISRTNLPADKKGVELSSGGKVLNADHVQQQLEDKGRAAKPGDRVAITAISFKDDSIEFAINGGPHTTHWYDHLSVGMGGSTSPVVTSDQRGPSGAEIVLRYPHALPSLTPEQVKQALKPLIDWNRPSEAEEMVKALPAPVKDAIAHHKVLVGMTPDMVVAALGRTGNKTGETDASGQQYEDWVYGHPPQPTKFVRIENGRVIRVTTYEPNGTEVVEDKVDPSLAAAEQRDQRQRAIEAQEADEPAPSLRRPGDPAPQPARTVPVTPAGMPPNAAPNQQPDGFPQSMPGSPGNGMPPNGMPPDGTPPTGPPTTSPPVCCSAQH